MFKQDNQNDINARMNSLVLDNKLVTDSLNVSNDISSSTMLTSIMDATDIYTTNHVGERVKLVAANTLAIPLHGEFERVTVSKYNLEGSVEVDQSNIVVSDLNTSVVINSDKIIVDGEAITKEKIKAWDETNFVDFPDNQFDMYHVNDINKKLAFDLSETKVGKSIVQPKLLNDTQHYEFGVCDTSYTKMNDLLLSNNSVNLGVGNTVNHNSVIVGYNNNIVHNNCFVFGNNTNSANNNEMILGNNSVQKVKMYGLLGNVLSAYEDYSVGVTANNELGLIPVRHQFSDSYFKLYHDIEKSKSVKFDLLDVTSERTVKMQNSDMFLPTITSLGLNNDTYSNNLLIGSGITTDNDNTIYIGNNTYSKLKIYSLQDKMMTSNYCLTLNNSNGEVGITERNKFPTTGIFLGAQNLTESDIFHIKSMSYSYYSGGSGTPEDPGDTVADVFGFFGGAAGIITTGLGGFSTFKAFASLDQISNLSSLLSSNVANINNAISGINSNITGVTDALTNVSDIVDTATGKLNDLQNIVGDHGIKISELSNVIDTISLDSTGHLVNNDILTDSLFSNNYGYTIQNLTEFVANTNPNPFGLGTMTQNHTFTSQSALRGDSLAFYSNSNTLNSYYGNDRTVTPMLTLQNVYPDEELIMDPILGESKKLVFKKEGAVSLTSGELNSIKNVITNLNEIAQPENDQEFVYYDTALSKFQSKPITVDFSAVETRLTNIETNKNTFVGSVSIDAEVLSSAQLLLMKTIVNNLNTDKQDGKYLYYSAANNKFMFNSINLTPYLLITLQAIKYDLAKNSISYYGISNANVGTKSILLTTTNRNMGDYAIVMGENNEIAVGSTTPSTNVLLGYNVRMFGGNNVLIGRNNTDFTGGDNIVIGSGATMESASYNLLIGNSGHKFVKIGNILTSNATNYTLGDTHTNAYMKGVYSSTTLSPNKKMMIVDSDNKITAANLPDITATDINLSALTTRVTTIEDNKNKFVIPFNGNLEIKTYSTDTVSFTRNFTHSKLSLLNSLSENYIKTAMTVDINCGFWFDEIFMNWNLVKKIDNICNETIYSKTVVDTSNSREMICLDTITMKLAKTNISGLFNTVTEVDNSKTSADTSNSTKLICLDSNLNKLAYKSFDISEYLKIADEKMKYDDVKKSLYNKYMTSTNVGTNSILLNTDDRKYGNYDIIQGSGNQKMDAIGGTNVIIGYNNKYYDSNNILIGANNYNTTGLNNIIIGTGHELMTTGNNLVIGNPSQKRIKIGNIAYQNTVYDNFNLKDSYNVYTTQSNEVYSLPNINYLNMYLKFSDGFVVNSYTTKVLEHFSNFGINVDGTFTISPGTTAWFRFVIPKDNIPARLNTKNLYFTCDIASNSNTNGAPLQANVSKGKLFTLSSTEYYMFQCNVYNTNGVTNLSLVGSTLIFTPYATTYNSGDYYNNTYAYPGLGDITVNTTGI